ncbi:MAG TPA: hypothetical protein VJ970_00785 [Flavobacteriaceae bacterium]|nr:hypothetical protein [Flavobacteriaceae bacterium]
MRKLLFISISLLTSLGLFAQETKPDTLKTEEITVVKPYTPKISDAFKIKLNPTINVENIEKQNVNYKIYSIPVASIFQPTKGRAKKVTRPPKQTIYNNYISAGFGTFTTPFFEAYLKHSPSKYTDVGVFVNHISSEGGIDDLQLNDNYADTSIEAFYNQFNRDYNWQINAGVTRNQTNFYGLPEQYNFSENVIEAIDEKQVYKTLKVGSKIAMEDSFFKGASAEMINFSDSYSSNEFRLVASPKLGLPISTEKISAEFLADLVVGKFNQTYLGDTNLEYSFLKLGVTPVFEIRRENLAIDLGAKLYYNSDLENSNTDFKAYPNIVASYKLIDDVLIITAGATGDLVHNTYQNFVAQNPYVAPTLNILQTDKQYKAFGGIKGKLANNIIYNLEVSQSNEVNKPFFIHNQIQTDGNTEVEKAFQAGNSFNVIYDEVKTLSFYGEMGIEASEEFNFKGTLTYNNYTTTNLFEAWNSPKFMATITGNYSNNNWYAGATLFFRGKTKDYFKPHPGSTTSPEIMENKSYIDLNLSGGYHFSDRLTAFAKIQNALGEKYHRYLFYQVQPQQFLAGITYKFDL